MNHLKSSPAGKRFKMAALIIPVVAAFGSGNAYASFFDGNDVTTQYYAYGGTYASPGNATFVAPGSTSYFSEFTLAVTDTQITYTFLPDITTWSASAPSLDAGGLYIDNGVLVTAGPGVPAITSVTIDSASSIPSSFTSADVTFNSDNVAVTWGGQTFTPGEELILDINSRTTTTGVPEPAMLSLLGLCLASLGLARRRTGNK